MTLLFMIDHYHMPFVAVPQVARVSALASSVPGMATEAAPDIALALAKMAARPYHLGQTRSEHSRRRVQITPEARISIEHHCQRLQTVYAVAADHGDVEAFVNCFAADGEILVPGTPVLRGHEAIRASIFQLGALGVTYRHLITNQLVTVNDSNSASGICYLLTFNTSAPADADGARPIEAPGTVGEYLDAFVNTKEGWRIQRRELKRVFRREDAVAVAAARLAPRA